MPVLDRIGAPAGAITELQSPARGFAPGDPDFAAKDENNPPCRLRQLTWWIPGSWHNRR